MGKESRNKKPSKARIMISEGNLIASRYVEKPEKVKEDYPLVLKPMVENLLYIDKKNLTNAEKKGIEKLLRLFLDDLQVPYR